MSIKQVYYNIDNILKENALINLIYGEKSNGKSYQVKHKLAVLHYIKTKKRFIILRRWQADISSVWCEKYFSDVDVPSLTDNEYEFISVYRKKLFFSKIINDKVVRGEQIGYVIALSGEQHYSSASFLDVDMIIFEEFMERGSYLPREPSRLMIFYSTVDRKRGTTKMFLVGNTISRVCPYLTDWNLLDTIRQMKQGEIRKINFQNDETTVSIAIEYCRDSGGKKLAIGDAKSMIDSGSWQTTPQPKLPKSKKEYDVKYRIGFLYKGFKFLAELLQDKITKDIIWFIMPYNKEFKDNILIFSDVVKPNINYQRDIYQVSFRRENKRLQELLDTFRENCIFYSDDLTGTDFKTAIDFVIKK